MIHAEPINRNYAAVVVAIPAPQDLPGLDNLVGVPVLGHHALTQKGRQAGELMLAFTAETALSPEYAAANNLYRHVEKNRDPAEAGYLEDSGRVKAIKMRGHQSNALLMPLESIAFTGVNPADLAEGDTFDHLGGVEICHKYELPVKGDPHQGQGQGKVAKAFKRVDDKVFPEHLSTDQFGRNKHLLRPDREVILTSKLHGSSARFGRVPVRREKGWAERFINRWIATPDYEFANVYGSRKVIKDANNPNQNHFYTDDIWTRYGKTLDGLIPDGWILYGELIGWAGKGSPIQKGYTYDLEDGQIDFYVYRIGHVNEAGVLADLSWDGVREFCQARGIKHVPEIGRVDFNEERFGVSPDVIVDFYMDKRYADSLTDTVDPMVPLSTKKTVDEGICLRQEGIVPIILKAKSGRFLEHETQVLDEGIPDMEGVA